MSKESILQSHKTKIYPWIKVLVNDHVPEEEIFKLPNNDFPVSQSWLGDLAIFYVADMDDHYQIILQSDLDEEYCIEDLHILATSNLSENITYKIHETEFGGYGLICGADLEATSLTLPEIWESVGQYLGENILVAAAARDLILIVPESDKDKLANMKIFIYKLFKDGEKLLSRNIFRYDFVNKEWEIVDNVPI